VQDGLLIPASAVEEFIAEADARGWPEVVRANLYLAVVRSIELGARAESGALARLLARAEADGDAVMTAIALAMRSQASKRCEEPVSSVAAERDLARATILLEGAGGETLERASAHIVCAIAYGARSLRSPVVGLIEMSSRSHAVDDFSGVAG
jgi:hypothetical protein